MGLMVDSNVFIRRERSGSTTEFDSDDDVRISAVVASELLVGVHRAKTPEQREKRAAFVAAVLDTLPVVDATLEIARLHAKR